MGFTATLALSAACCAACSTVVMPGYAVICCGGGVGSTATLLSPRAKNTAGTAVFSFFFTRFVLLLDDSTPYDIMHMR